MKTMISHKSPVNEWMIPRNSKKIHYITHIEYPTEYDEEVKVVAACGVKLNERSTFRIFNPSEKECCLKCRNKK